MPERRRRPHYNVYPRLWLTCAKSRAAGARRNRGDNPDDLDIVG